MARYPGTSSSCEVKENFIFLLDFLIYQNQAHIKVKQMGALGSLIDSFCECYMLTAAVKWKSSSVDMRFVDLFSLRKSICSKSMYVVLRVREGDTYRKILSIQVRPSNAVFGSGASSGNWKIIPNCCHT